MAERQFVVVQDIAHGGVLAYTRGQTITDADAIERNGWQDHVVVAGTKSAAEVHAEITGRDPADFTTAAATTRSAKSSGSDSASTEQKG